MKVAVVGAGIAGLYSAWRLSRDHAVTVFEANDYAGGHTNTIDVDWAGKPYAVNTGFIVFNNRTYPQFTAMLNELGVSWQNSNMSFSLSSASSGLEYNGTSLNSLFAQRLNLLRPSFLRMLAEILRFNREAKTVLTSPAESATLGEYLRDKHYGQAFIEHYILPMGRSIWSAPAQAMLHFPVRMFVDFFNRHGFLEINDRPTWYAVKGGSREYVRRLLTASSRAVLRLRTPISTIQRTASQVTITPRGAAPETFDAVFLACHADQALKMLSAPSPAERQILGSFPYAENEAILHTDASVLPRKALARAAWNYHHLRAADIQEPLAITYDMNVLQALDAPVKFLVSLNYARAIDPGKIIRRVQYSHPVYLPAGVAAQLRHREINGRQRTYFCGAYWRHGFHEDGVVSAQAALAHFIKDSSGAQRYLQRTG